MTSELDIPEWGDLDLLSALDDGATSGEATLVSLALLGRRVDSLLVNLAVIRRTISQRMAGEMTTPKLVLDGVGLIERYRSSTWKPYTDHTELELVRNVAERGRGKLRSPREAAARAGLFIAEAASLTWRVTQLRNAGIDPRTYLDQKHGDWSVRIPKE